MCTIVHILHKPMYLMHVLLIYVCCNVTHLKLIYVYSWRYGLMIVTHLYNLENKFYAKCPSYRNLLHLSRLRTNIKKHRNVSLMAGICSRICSSNRVCSSKISKYLGINFRKSHKILGFYHPNFTSYNAFILGGPFRTPPLR